MWLAARLAFPAAADAAEACPEPPRDACLHDVVTRHRAALEAASGSCTDGACVDGAVQPILAKAGVRKPAQREKAVAIFDALPRFHDTTGVPLNAAAQRLVEDGRMGSSTGGGGADGPPARATFELRASGGETHAGQLPRVSIAPGTWKYVLLRVEDARGGKALLVRNQANKAYHAEMAAGARAELSALGGGLRSLAVLGGGRIAYSSTASTINVFGYSKTYGRCAACNQLSSELIRAAPEFRRYAVRWSNEGY